MNQRDPCQVPLPCCPTPASLGWCLPESPCPPPAPCPLPFETKPASSDVRLRTTYGYYNDDDVPGIEKVRYLYKTGGFDVYSRTATVMEAPFLVQIGAPGRYNTIAVYGGFTTVLCPKLKRAYGWLELANSDYGLTRVELPLLEYAEYGIKLQFNASLVNVRFPSLITAPNILVHNCALSQESVDNILADLVAFGWGGPGQVLLLNNGTNSPPGVQGALDASELIARGATVLTN